MVVVNEQESADIDYQQPLPWVVWLTAYAFCLMGGWALGSDLVRYLSGSETEKGFIILFALGIGLFAKHNWARLLISYLSAMYLAFALAFLIMLPFVAGETARDASNDLLGRELNPWLAKFVLMTLVAVIAFMSSRVYEALTDPDLIARFRIPLSQRPRDARRQFSLNSLLLMAPIAITIALPMSDRFVHRSVDRRMLSTTNPDDSITIITYGCSQASIGDRSTQLEYILFQRGRPGESVSGISWSDATDSRDDRSTLLHVPGQPAIECPNDTQIYEYRDGKLTRYPNRVSYAKLEAFMQQKEGIDWSAESLIDFAARQED